MLRLQQMNIFERFIVKLDKFQRRHLALALFQAVTKKYGEDNGGNLAALITYYGFLSLFPLLIVFTTLTQLLLHNNPTLLANVSSGVTHYLPVVGHQLQESVHSSANTGLALMISLFVTFYGARGVANALQYALNNVWGMPVVNHPSFPKNTVRSLGILSIGGLALVSTAVLSALIATISHGWLSKTVVMLLNVSVLWVAFIYVLKFAIAGHKIARDVWRSALFIALGIQILQIIGVLLFNHQLNGLRSAYGTFALTLSLLFWIYLQAQVILYACETDIVLQKGLYPRSLHDPLSTSDRRALQRKVKATQQHPSESIQVRFRTNSKISKK